MEIYVSSLRKEMISLLGSFGIEAAEFESDYLIEHFTGITKLKMLTDSSVCISEAVRNTIMQAVHDRIGGKPLQHIIGYTEFMGLKFKVNEDVLVPRPDTEILVQEAIGRAKKLLAAYGKNYNNKIKILDMCTGSGCIAVSLKHFLPCAEIHASDISEKALAVARENALHTRVGNETAYESIVFHHGSFFEPFGKNYNESVKFDIIVSNPPYIPTDDIDKLKNEVKLFDPILALDGGKDGFTAYKKIISEAPLYINKGGYLIFEAGIGQADGISDFMKRSFSDIEIVRDYGGIERVVYGKLN